LSYKSTTLIEQKNLSALLEKIIKANNPDKDPSYDTGQHFVIISAAVLPFYPFDKRANELHNTLINECKGYNAQPPQEGENYVTRNKYIIPSDSSLLSKVIGENLEDAQRKVSIYEPSPGFVTAFPPASERLKGVGQMFTPPCKGYALKHIFETRHPDKIIFVDNDQKVIDYVLLFLNHPENAELRKHIEVYRYITPTPEPDRDDE
jgi:hypothetical protein